MGAKVKWIVGWWTVLAATVVLGQAGRPGQVGAAAGPTTTPAVEDVVMPKGPYNGVALGDLIDLLKHQVPGFDAIVIRAPQVPADYPTFDNFSPKNVTIGQFLDLVRSSFPGVDVRRIDGRMGPLYVFEIGNGGQFNVPMGSGAPAAPGTIADTSTPIVRVYPLGGIVSALGGDTKQSLNNVLSLLQTTLDAEGGSQGATLKVHEPTMMLVFKGSVGQMQVLEQAIAALKPKVDTTSQMAQMEQKYEAELQRLQASQTGYTDTMSQLRQQLDKETRQAEEYRLQAMTLETDLNALKQNTTANTKPKE